MFVGHRPEQFKKHELGDIVGVCCMYPSQPSIINNKLWSSVLEGKQNYRKWHYEIVIWRDSHRLWSEKIKESHVKECQAINFLKHFWVLWVLFLDCCWLLKIFCLLWFFFSLKYSLWHLIFYLSFFQFLFLKWHPWIL